MPLAGETLIFPPYESADDPTPVNPRPALTLQQATDLTQKLYGRTVTKISTLPSHVDQNFLMVDKEDTKYILKIINSEDSKNDTLLELQTLALSCAPEWNSCTKSLAQHRWAAHEYGGNR